MIAALRAAYRRTGADAPWCDPRGDHGVPMEGYFWRLARDDGGAVVALCGVTRHGGPGRAQVALTGSPGRVAVRRAGPVAADARTLGLRVEGVLEASPSRLRVDLGAEGGLELRSAGPPVWDRALGGLGIAGSLPWMGQYWHPYALGTPASGTLRHPGGRAEPVSGLLYAEKNWGPGFPHEWWWLEAHDAATAVAAAGGLLTLGPLRIPATSLVLRHGRALLRFTAPTAVVRARVGSGGWEFDAHRGRDRVRVHGAGDPRGPAPLPLPPPPDGPAGGHVGQHLAGTVRIRWTRGARLLLDEEIRPAGMEYGIDPRVARE